MLNSNFGTKQLNFQGCLCRSMRRWAVVGVLPCILYLLIPFLFYIYPPFMEYLFFLNFLRIPFQKYDDIASHGVVAKGRNFYLVGKEKQRIGCWHLLPSILSSKNDTLSEMEMENLLSSSKCPVIVYLHGNSYDRTQPNRCRLYDVLASLNFHVLACDYRGYGDSSGSADEHALIEDAKEIFRYAKKLSGKNKVLMWGHSMGSGVAVAAAMQLSIKGTPPYALILESAFNNLRDVVANHPFALPFRWLPWFDRVLLDSLPESGINMSSDLRITKITCPILMLHAADDNVIPIELGKKLRDAAVNANRVVTFVEFDASNHFEHKFIYRAEKLPKILEDFIKEVDKLEITAHERN